jgi:GlpG protein
MYLVYRFEETEDPTGLTKALWQHKVAHQIVSAQGYDELWILDPGQLSIVEQLINIWKEDPSLLQQTQPAAEVRRVTTGGISNQLKRSPVTTILLLLTLLVAVITQLGADIKAVSYFTISSIHIMDGRIYFSTLANVLADGEYWRLFSPALLHFSVLHIVFNTLWVWDIGGKLERILGSIVWSIGVAIIAILSNVLQYQISEYPLFGGLSGVVYGLIGFAWLLPLLNKHWPVIISKQLMVFFVVWLGVGYTPFPEMIGLGSIANTAHSIGLLSGLALGLVYWLATKHRYN